MKNNTIKNHNVSTMEALGFSAVNHSGNYFQDKFVYGGILTLSAKKEISRVTQKIRNTLKI